jgi:hypothetical protein
LVLLADDAAGISNVLMGGVFCGIFDLFIGGLTR